MCIKKIFLGLSLIALIIFNQACSTQTGKKENNQEVHLLDKFVMGVDLSYVNQVEDHGGVFKENNEHKDVFQIFKDNGANVVRLRIWNNPFWTYEVYGEDATLYSGFSDVKKSIQRAHEQGMAVNLDFHYSDVWADPEHQKVPAAWKEITDIEVLSDSVYHYTYQVMDQLLQASLLPEMVQIGNETNCGMMLHEANDAFPKLSICDENWENFGKVLNAGIKAVRDIDEKAGETTVIALHVADPKNLDWWFKGIIEKAGVTDFDVAGFSYYPHWHTEVSFQDLPKVVAKLKADIQKEIMILETAYPYTLENADNYPNIFGKDSAIDGYPISIEGQQAFLTDLTQNMIDAGAKGVMYWEPAWIASDMKDLWSQGSGWDNATLFDAGGNATAAIQYLSHDYTKTK